MKKDDELDEVGVGLLPEWFLATAEKIVQERGDVVREGVSVQVVVKRVVAVLGIEADFDVILGPLVTRRECLLPSRQKSPFHFQNQSADPLRLCRPLCRPEFARRTGACSTTFCRCQLRPRWRFR